MKPIFPSTFLRLMGNIPYNIKFPDYLKCYIMCRNPLILFAFDIFHDGDDPPEDHEIRLIYFIKHEGVNKKLLEKLQITIPSTTMDLWGTEWKDSDPRFFKQVGIPTILSTEFYVTEYSDTSLKLKMSDLFAIQRVIDNCLKEVGIKSNMFYAT